MHRRAHGFTLLEMMVVVAIIAIISVIAVFSIASNTAERETEKFTAIVLDNFKIASERAKNYKKVYAVRITQTTVQWCEGSCKTNGTPRGEEYDGAKDNLKVKNLKYAKMADFGQDSRPALTGVSDMEIYFYPDGSMDSDGDPTKQEGFTVYIQHDRKTKIQRRIAIMPLSGEIRKFASWD